ncbi:phosphoethanolamine transferase [Ideonella alba]|nr:phosphoethanolamine--lipid A transferase [Ideonella alba]
MSRPLMSPAADQRGAPSTDTLALVASLWFALACNLSFWHEVLSGRDATAPATWLFAGALFVALVAVHFLLLGLVLHRAWAKPLLGLLLVATAFAVHYTQKFNVYLDPSMLRNVLRTDVKEASELFTWSMAPHLLFYAVLPLLLLWWVPIRRRRWPGALARRIGWLLLAAALGVGAVMAVFQDFGSLMRNRKELRYLITPANYLYSLGRVAVADTRSAAKPREPLGTDARPGAAWAARSKPTLFVFVLGETARAANWGLSGYARQTTPQLAEVPGLINFKDVSACGTNTETSVPCLFSPWGRRQYDEDRIRGSQGLLHVLDHAGLGTFWRDNQSGCKGVCDGLPNERLATTASALCDGERCLDEALLRDLDAPLVAASATAASAAQGLPKAVTDSRVVVLHMLGNHGPAYYKRYPASFRRFEPTCDTPDLRQCEIPQIVNTYDNALLYTDHVLARTIDWLKARQDRYDTALIYVSDHGESLGENRLFLHGVPYAIAPKEQTQVPMVAWFSPGFADSRRLDLGCVQARAAQPASHDHLFHSLLGLMDVKTAVREPAMDLFAPCRR